MDQLFLFWWNELLLWLCRRLESTFLLMDPTVLWTSDLIGEESFLDTCRNGFFDTFYFLMFLLRIMMGYGFLQLWRGFCLLSLPLAWIWIWSLFLHGIIFLCTLWCFWDGHHCHLCFFCFQRFQILKWYLQPCMGYRFVVPFTVLLRLSSWIFFIQLSWDVSWYWLLRLFLWLRRGLMSPFCLTRGGWCLER